MDSLAPRSPSPDLKNSRPYPAVVDPSVGPFAYSPNKDVVLIENPAWTIGEKRPQAGPSETQGPGDYDPQYPESKGFTFAPDRGSKQGESSPGPGGYNVEAADKQTKPRNPEIRLGGREEKKRDTSNDGVGPGTYGDSQPKFGEGVKTFTIQEKREPSPPQKVPAPGEYDTNENAIRHKSPNAKFSKSKGRPESFAHQAQGDNAGPGAYYTAQPFDAKTKSIPINKEPRDKRPAPQSGPTGPGAYNSETGEKLTKARTKSALIVKQKRPDNFTKNREYEPAPGEYNVDKPFGSGLNKVVIEGKRAKKIEPNPGPGAYEADKAQAAIRPASPMTKISKARARPKSFANPNASSVGPGAYDDGKRWNSNVKPMTIAKKRDRPPSSITPAAGSYNPERAEALTRPKTAYPKFDKSPSRPRNFAVPGTEGTAGPG